jgi:hypothetical protein
VLSPWFCLRKKKEKTYYGIRDKSQHMMHAIVYQQPKQGTQKWYLYQRPLPDTLISCFSTTMLQLHTQLFHMHKLEHNSNMELDFLVAYIISYLNCVYPKGGWLIGPTSSKRVYVNAQQSHPHHHLTISSNRGWKRLPNYQYLCIHDLPNTYEVCMYENVSYAQSYLHKCRI